MFDGVQTTAAAAAAAAGTPTATTTDPRDSFITTLCSCTHQQQPRQQPIRLSRKEKTKSDRTRRIRVSTSLPNCALSREPKAEAEQHQSDVTAPEPVSSASVLNCSHKQQQQQQKGRGGRGCVVGAVEKAKSRGPPEQRQQHNHHTPQHMAFLGTVRETVEFLRGTIGRSRRKGADLAGGRELAQRAGPGNNGNGVCPAPDNANGPSACTSAAQQQQQLQQKRTVLISFSQTGSAQCARKTAQSVDTCVADSFDDQMVDKMCSLPKGLDRHEWLASHVLALFEHVNCLSSTLSEVCTPVTCSTMSYPGNSKAQWVDERGKRHNYSAMRYIDSVMALCEGSRKNQSLFPTKYGAAFAAEFEQYCARMVRLLWHCAGHVYAKHWEHLTALNLRLQFGLVLAHMAKLAKLYSLMSDKELSPLMHTLQLARPSTTTMTTTSDSCEQPSSGAVVEQQQQHRPTKRALDDSTLTTTAGTTTASNGSSTAVQGRAIQQQKKAHKREAKEDCKQAQHHPQHCTLKSGSWGGHSASTVALTVAPAAAVADYGSELVKKNCQQQQQQKCCCAQTC